MSKLATEYVVTNSISGMTLPTYSSTTISMGSLMRISTGATNDLNYVGPFTIALARPNETSTAIPISHVYVLDYNSTTQWVIGGDNAAAAASRRFTFFEYNKTNSLYTWKGFIAVGHGAITTNHTLRGHRVLFQSYTTGTVTVNGTSVTGTNTLWTGSSLSRGCRIGFGSSAATDITAWYMVTGFTNNTALTISQTAGVSGSPINYIIEDFSIAFVTTNATAGNGGLFLVKGLRYEDFSVGGTNIYSASTDNNKGVYWLCDQPTLTNTAAAGIAIEEFDAAGNGWNLQPCYILDTNTRVYKYNLRAWLGSGGTWGAATTNNKTTNAILLSTSTQSFTGTLSQNNNGRVATLSHGPGAGVASLYFVTTTRIYRALLSNITNNNASWQSDVMIEIPPGGTATYAATAALNSVEILSNIDRLAVLTTHAAGIRSYITQYRTDSGNMGHVFLGDTKQIDQSSADSNNTTPFPNTQSTLMGGWSENGYFHIVRQGTTSIISQLYCIPINADWTYASSTNQRVIFPSMDTTGANKFYRGYVVADGYLGGSILGYGGEPIRYYARTSGIVDNSGLWTLLDDHLDLTGFAGADAIQFMAEFKTISLTCIPGRIHSICVVYEDDSTDSHYQPSVANSSITSKRFAWRFSTAFGSTVPTLRVRLYDAVSGGLLVDDDSAAPTGTWEKSTDGGSNWAAYNTTDKTNETTYIRYTPLSLGDNIKVRALLTQN